MLKINKIQFIILFCIYISFGCTTTRIQREVAAVTEAQELNQNANYLKVHMLDGKLYVLYNWNVNDNENTVSGLGSLYNANRNLTAMVQLETDKFIIPLSEVALFETNKVSIAGSSGSMSAMTIVTVPSVLLGVICLSDPKACFGSCPTFYASDGDTMVLQAEGFSSSIARVFEEKDIDMLYRARPKGDIFEISIKNEALETHVVRYADLLVIPRPENGRVFATPEGEFYQVSEIISPSDCKASEGTCLEAVSLFDNKERFSFTDSANLAQREIIELSFDSIPAGDLGLVVGSRQTLLTTYLFYQSLAYMGNSTSYWLAKLESGSKAVYNYALKLWKLLGGIEILIQDNRGKWVKAGKLDEMGPIASDVQLVKFPKLKNEKLNVRLKLTKGLWRVNYVALVKLDKAIEPYRLQPYLVLHGNNIDTIAQKQLLDPALTLVTFPRDSYTLTYCLPDANTNYEFFIESKGYYYEWMRKEWLVEENLKRTIMMFVRPSFYLKALASEFKKREHDMEQTFWRSKYVNK